MPIYSKLKYVKPLEKSYVEYKLTLGKEYYCKMVHVTGPQYMIWDDLRKPIIISGRMRKQFFKGVI